MKGSNAKACIQAYSSDENFNVVPLYSYINFSIYHDIAENLIELMPVIRIINRYCHNDSNDKHLNSCVVYRGVSYSKQKFAQFHPNLVLRFASYLSTSSSLDVAIQFAGKAESIFKIDVPPHIEAPHYRNISEYSKFPDESELLFVPYSKFIVLSTNTTLVFEDKTYNIIHLKALDNFKEERQAKQEDVKNITFQTILQ